MADKNTSSNAKSKSTKIEARAYALAKEILSDVSYSDNDKSRRAAPLSAAEIEIKEAASSALTKLTKNQSDRITKKIQFEETTVGKNLEQLFSNLSALDKKLNDANKSNDKNLIQTINNQMIVFQQKIAAFTSYQQDIQNLYYKATAEFAENPIDATTAISTLYIKQLDKIKTSIVVEDKNILSEDEKNNLLALANTVEKELEKRISLSSKLGRGLKKIFASEMAGNILNTAASNAPFVRLSVALSKSIIGAKKKPAINTLLQEQELRKKERDLYLAREKRSATVTTVSTQGNTPANDNNDTSGGTSLIINPTTNKPFGWSQDTNIMSASRVRQNQVTSDCCDETIKILNTHTDLLEKIYFVNQQQFKLYDKSLQWQMTAAEEYDLESQANRFGIATTATKMEPSAKGGVSNSIKEMIGAGFGGAIGGSIGSIIAGIAGRFLGVAGIAALSTGAIYLLDTYLTKNFPNFRERFKLQNGGDTLGAATAATGINITNAPRGSYAQYRNLSEPNAASQTGKILNIEPTQIRPTPPVEYYEGITDQFGRKIPKPSKMTFEGPPISGGKGSILFGAEEATTASRLGKFGSNFKTNISGQSKGFNLATKLGKGNAALAVAGTGYDMYKRKEAGQTNKQAAIGAISGTTGGILGSMVASAATGALVGSVVPVGGTVIGGLLGLGAGLVGGYYGSKYSAQAADYLTGASGATNAPLDDTTTFAQLSPEQQNAILAAQAAMEHGQGKPIKNNNPGNIMYSYPNGATSTYAHKFGGVPSADITSHGTLAQFPTMEAGMAAQRALWMSSSYKNLPIKDAIKKWAPGAPDTYAASLIKAANTPTPNSTTMASNKENTPPSQTTDIAALGRQETMQGLMSGASFNNSPITVNQFYDGSSHVIASRNNTAAPPRTIEPPFNTAVRAQLD